MTWLSILKATGDNPLSVGELLTRFSRGEIPTKKEIDGVSDKALQEKYLDATITNIKRDLALIKEGQEVPNSIISRMITGKRTKIAETKEKAIIKIEELLSQLQGLSIESTNPLYEKEIGGIKYSELVSPEGKTNQEWTKETLSSLYDMMGTNPSVNLLYAIYTFIEDSTNGRWRRGKVWRSNMGRDLETNPEALKNIFKLRLDPQVQESIDKKIFDFFTGDFKYTSAGINQIEITSGKQADEFVPKDSSRVAREGVRTRTKTVQDPTQMEISERTSDRLLTAENIGNKISQLTESQFTELVEKLQKTNSAEGIFQDIKNKSVGIVYDLGYKGQGINQLVRDIDVRRKGDAATQRRKDYLHDWVISYINKKMNNSTESSINISGYELLSRNELSNYTTKQDRAKDKYKKHYEKRDKLIDWIKEKVKSEDPTWLGRYETDIKTKNKLDSEFRNLSQEEQEEIKNDRQKLKQFYQMSGSAGPDFAELAYSFNIDKGLSDFIDMLEGPMNRYERAILALMFNSYMDSGLGGKDKALSIVPSGDFQQYLPTGRLFADKTQESFVDSMRALMTILKMVLDRTQLSEYNINISLAVNTFFANIDNYFKAEGSVETEEDRLNSMMDFIADGDFESNSTDWFDTKVDIKAAYNNLNDLLIELEKGIKAQLINNIQTIADDTTDKYKKQGLRIGGLPAGIREYLINKGFLRQTVTEEE